MSGFAAGNKGFVMVLCLLELLLLALLPFALMLDHRLDRQRPMYNDRQEVAVLQYDHAKQEGAALPMTLNAGETATIAGAGYTASKGITVTVELIEDGYCVRAQNDYGDATGWRCWKHGTDPRESSGVAR